MQKSIGLPVSQKLKSKRLTARSHGLNLIDSKLFSNRTYKESMLLVHEELRASKRATELRTKYSEQAMARFYSLYSLYYLLPSEKVIKILLDFLSVD